MGNGVLKGMNPRLQGNIPAKEQFSLSETKPKNTKDEKKIDTKQPEKQNEESTKTNNKKFVNQQAQIKLSETIKNELDALKIINKAKYDYEIVELLIDTYVQNSLTATQKRKFKALTSDDI